MPGVALHGTIAMYGLPGAMGGQYVEEAAPAQLTPGFHAAFLAGMVVCLIVVAISVFIREGQAGE